MKFFFPDALDMVDPTFDFAAETRSEQRVRQRDDQYAHEVFAQPPYDGLLVSKAIVDGHASDGSRYTLAQRQRLLREGAQAFFRIGNRPLEIMGDCGAFSYVGEKQPPVSVDEVLDFYEACRVDYGISVDHIILGYQAELDHCLPDVEGVPEEWRARQQLTLDLAGQFLTRHRQRRCPFVAVGVAQGWSPLSYAHCVSSLEKIGFTLIALGGLVPLKSNEILDVLRAVDDVRKPQTRLHLLGVTRCDHLAAFRKYGVVSFDSTSPLRQAFKDDKDNYYAPDRTYTAVRVPQVEGNAKLQRRIAAGEVQQEEARRLEQACLRGLAEYDTTGEGLAETLEFLRDYELIHDKRKDHRQIYRTTLGDRPWQRCPCEICRRLGVHVVLFRGAERNRRRGFHNLFVTYQRLRAELQQLESAGRPRTGECHDDALPPVALS